MYLKTGVRLWDLKPQVIVGSLVCEEMWKTLADAPFYWTSCNDGVHSTRSRHNLGMAIDIRTNTMARNKLDTYVAMVKSQLDDDFDIVLEDRDLPNEHLHVEYDPWK